MVKWVIDAPEWRKIYNFTWILEFDGQEVRIEHDEHDWEQSLIIRPEGK